jgi:hypothetical protein
MILTTAARLIRLRVKAGSTRCRTALTKNGRFLARLSTT